MHDPSSRRIVQPAVASPFRVLLALVLLAFLAGSFACSYGMDEIDDRTQAILNETSSNIGGGAYPPDALTPSYPPGDALTFPSDSETFNPRTINPAASDIPFATKVDTTSSTDTRGPERANDTTVVPIFAENATEKDVLLDLEEALRVAVESAREYQTSEETYVIVGLQLLSERHRWGPRLFDDLSATVDADGNNSLFDSSLSVINELGVTQRLPYGGEVSASLLARATENLAQRVAGENVQSAEILLDANIPLLRGAGVAAREPRIQAERDMIYAARDFERFRREFLVDISRDFLNLVVQQQAIANAENQLQRLVEFADRETALVESGRAAPFDAALSAQDVLFAEDDLQTQRENYRFAVDRFKVRLGLPVDTRIVIIPSTLGLPAPEPNAGAAVQQALLYRLDLQTARDQVEDSSRAVDIARNGLLPDFGLFGSVRVPTDSDLDRAGLQFEAGDSSFTAGVNVSLPLDREIEKYTLRQAQIRFEQSQRDFDEFRDNLIINVRDAVREIERALFSLELQEENVRIARLRLQSIDAAPDRATARDRSEAADDLTRAQDQRDRAQRDLQVAILEYLLATGTLRVNDEGMIMPLNGMTLSPSSGSEQAAPAEPIEVEDVLEADLQAPGSTPSEPSGGDTTDEPTAPANNGSDASDESAESGESGESGEGGTAK